MQDSAKIRDHYRAIIDDMDCGYVRVAEAMGVTQAHISKTLSPKNVPRLSTLKRIKAAIQLAKSKQTGQVADLMTI
ncbi:hypothetical protein A6C57_25685 [Fibrella sp. ES10-3-2-2]|nr:hypothetical protein A6C57_25685 [Fibrella sp. ES10-3-2-2]